MFYVIILIHIYLNLIIKQFGLTAQSAAPIITKTAVTAMLILMMTAPTVRT